MDVGYWTGEYDRVRAPPLNPALVGFNVNLDRVIPVTKDLLYSPDFQKEDFGGLRSHLIHSMEHCTAEEWFITDREQYSRFMDYFSGTGSLSLGGQAGIAALNLARLGAPEVFCLAPAMGRESAQILRQHGIHVARTGSDAARGEDSVHLIFEYQPGLIPLADGALPRNNRFIASPQKTPENTLLDQDILNEVLPQISPYTRAFLSGYQYLRDDGEFARAADQIRALKAKNPLMRVHIECVSVTDTAVLAGIVHHILTVADSAGMNEHELSLLSGHKGGKTPSGLVQGILTLARETGLARIHLHTFGYYLLVIHKDRATPETSRAALMYASRVAAEAAGGTGTTISPQGIEAVRELAHMFDPGPYPGVFTDGNYLIVAVPTRIASGITRTVGLGDILSSTAFVADQF